MWKYKKEFKLAILVSSINIIFTLLLSNGETPFNSIYVHILNDYTYVFFFIIVLFVNSFEPLEQDLIIYKFESINDYLLSKIIEKIKSYGVLFILFTCVQIVLFYIVDENFNLITLLYRNVVFYVLILVTNFIILIRRKQSQLIASLFLCLLWSIFYFIFIIFPNSVFNSINVFMLLKKIDLSEMLRYLIFILIIIILNLIRVSKKERCVKKWLD